ncbi:MAG: restriction endonuclease subunit S [Candidatus Izemoplasmatales bacterium]|nr:restriction endonuclease subunit S [Candidatus Izemoplasmatales bacterium]MDD4070253.1 restriction endonuclease subunit S [Candidatus Izemoplasmatales bacterium]
MNINECCYIVNEKIKSNSVDINKYVTTENMISNFGGIKQANSIPAGSITKVEPNDILISNIRPYFKKIWLSSIYGGCSSDIICLRAREGHNAKYIYYNLVTDNFINVFVKSAKGTKMPRGEKSVLLNYPIHNVTHTEQQHIVDTIGSIDDLIENLNTINCKINDLIQIIFRKHTHHLNTTRIGNLKGYSIIKSGIKTFSGTKVYLNTASVNENGISSNDYIITMKDKPSRANMQPIPNSVWFAKLKDSPKFLYVRDFMEYILNNYIFSTGFMGLVCDNSYVSNYMYSLITSKQFDENKNALSIGATMQGINNDSFKEIQVPNVNINLMTTIGKEAESKIKFIYYNKKKIERLTLLKKNYLKKFFG